MAQNTPAVPTHENGKSVFGNFSKAPAHQLLDLKNPLEKPVSIPPPETLREARLSPWWPQYRDAMQVEYDDHLENKT